MEPGFRRPFLLDLLLLSFGRDADLAFFGRVIHRHKMPRLQVRSVRRGAGGGDAILDHFAGDMPVRKVTDGATSAHLFVKLTGALKQVRVRLLGRFWRRLKGRGDRAFKEPSLSIGARTV